MIKGTAKTSLVLGITAFLLVGSFGMSHAGMDTQMDGQMTDCPFTPGVSICNMSPLEMIAASQSMFTTLPLQKDFASLLLLLLSAALAFALIFKPLSPPRIAPTRIAVPKREYIPISNALQELFSSGILNPKLF